MTGKFRLCLAHTLKWEGGYVNDPVDPGGETNMGISRRAYPDEDIAGMTYERAARLYWHDYWLPCGAQSILSLPLAAKLFDLSVNLGPRRAVKLLQRAIGARVDGIIGPETVSLANADPHALRYLQREATLYYVGLIQRKPAMRKYFKGWINRLEDTLCFPY